MGHLCHVLHYHPAYRKHDKGTWRRQPGPVDVDAGFLHPPSDGQITVYFFVCMITNFPDDLLRDLPPSPLSIPMLVIGIISSHWPCWHRYGACCTRLWTAGWNHCEHPPAGGCFRSGFDHYPCRNRRDLGTCLPDAYRDASCGRDQASELGNNRFL